MLDRSVIVGAGIQGAWLSAPRVRGAPWVHYATVSRCLKRMENVTTNCMTAALNFYLPEDKLKGSPRFFRLRNLPDNRAAFLLRSDPYRVPSEPAHIPERTRRRIHDRMLRRKLVGVL